MRRYIKTLVFSCMAMTILGFGLLGYSSRAVAAEETAILAGGCFWCVESYKAVSAGGTGYIEAVKIVFDPDKTSYSNILDVFWRSVDPTDDGGQFCDRGESYKTAIFATTDAQKETAQSSKAALNESGVLKKPIVTEIRDAPKFYPAEEYHQDYYNKNPIRYKFYRFSCGRDAKIVELWGDQAHQGILDH